LHECVHEVRADGRAAEELRELREAEQPVRIPRGPVGIVAVGDSVDGVVRLGGLVQERRDAVVTAHSGGASAASSSRIWWWATVRCRIGRSALIPYTLRRPTRSRVMYPLETRSLRTRCAWRSVMSVAAASSRTVASGFRCTSRRIAACDVMNAQPSPFSLREPAIPHWRLTPLADARQYRPSR